MERFDVLTKEGLPTGETKARGDVHRDGDWHGSVHIWIIREGKVLLQQRSATKDSFPRCFDVACTGHIDAGETPAEAAVREVAEELGLAIRREDLRFLFQQKLEDRDGGFVSNEINHVYLLSERKEVKELPFSKEEIIALRWEGIESLHDKLMERDSSYCVRLDEYRKVLCLAAGAVRCLGNPNRRSSGGNI